MSNMGDIFAEVEAEMLKQFKAITHEQLAEEARRRKVKAEYEALHTAIETDEDRANTDEYPEDDEEEPV